MIKETLVSICKQLNKHNVEYLIIGGIAVIYYGYPRSTGDLDFWYNPTLSNFHKIIEVFRGYEIDVSELEKIVFDPRKTFLRFPINTIEVEFLPSIAGDLTFREAKSKATDLHMEGVSMPVIAFSDLIKNKSVTNRLKDKADVEELTKRKNLNSDI